MSRLVLDGQSLRMADLCHAVRQRRVVAADGRAYDKINQARAFLEKRAAQGDVFYGMQCGVGSQKDQSMKMTDSRLFSERLMVAHATRLPGDTYAEEVGYAAIIILLNHMASGRTAVSLETFERLLSQQNSWPSLGEMQRYMSVGVSDLVPLMQLIVPLFKDQDILQAKEALTMMCANAVTLAQLSFTLDALEQWQQVAARSYVLALEGFMGRPHALEAARYAYVDPSLQHSAVCHLLELMTDSDLWREGEPRFLQDPLSFRCQPHSYATLAASMAELRQSGNHWLNLPTDNPLLLAEEERWLCHANSDTMPLTLKLDTLRQALAMWVQRATAQMNKLHWSAFSDMPTGLAESPHPMAGVQVLNVDHLAEAQKVRLMQLAQPVALAGCGSVAEGVEDVGGFAEHAVLALEDMLPHLWNHTALLMAVSVWAITVRDRESSQLAQGIREDVAAIRPLLPMGKEGGAVWELQSLIDYLQDSVVEAKTA